MKTYLTWILLLLGSCGFVFAEETEPVVSEGLDFVQNVGQWSPEVRFQTDIQGGRLFLNPAGFTYAFYSEDDLTFYHDALTEHILDSLAEDHSIRFHALKTTFPGSNSLSALSATGKKSTYNNYYYGSDPSKWAAKTPIFGAVEYAELYSGIDLAVYSHGHNLKYDFICSPGSDPSEIAIRFEGQDSIWLAAGELHLETSVNHVTEKMPIAFQWIGGEKVTIPCEFELNDGTVTFSFPGGYDPDLDLVIDPEVIFASWSGALSPNWGSCATKGLNESLISAGISFNTGYPTTAGAYQQNFAGGFQDAVITEFTADGSTLLYSTYLGGGTSREFPRALEINDNGELFLLGITNSTDFPVTANAFDNTHNGGDDLFICRFAPGGQNLVASTYVGGSGTDGAFIANTFDSAERSGLVLDEDDNVYVATSTSSFNFPRSANAFQNNFIGFFDGAVFKMPPTLDVLTWGTFYGGTQTDAAFDLHLDDNRNVFICGATSSANLPMTPGAWQDTHGGNWDGYVAQISADGTTLMASTFIGTSTYENALMLERYENGDLLVTGGTMNPTFVTTTGAYSNFRGNNYVLRLSPNLQNLLVASKFGPGKDYPDITPTAFRLDSCERIYYAGWASFHRHWLPRMPITPDALQSDTDPRNFYLAVFEENMSDLLHGTFFGGKPSMEHTHARDMYFDEHGVLYHAVCTGCRIVFLAGAPPSPGAANQIKQHSDGWNDFPTTTGAWAENSLVYGCNLATFKIDMDFWEVEGDFDPPATGVCMDQPAIFVDRSSSGDFFYWDFGDGQTAQGDSVAHFYTAPGTYSVQMIVEDTIKCLPFDTVVKSVTILPLPNADAGPDVVVCPQNGQRLAASGGGTYFWTPPEGLSAATIANPIALPDSNTLYRVEVTSADGCTASDSVFVKILPMISDFAWSPGQPLPGETVQFTDLTYDAVNWRWDFGEGTTSQLENPDHTYPEEGSYQVTLWVENVLGCEDSLVKTIEVIAETGVYVPSGFTPNGDGTNDFFEIKGLEIQALSLQVYDRWGRELFTSAGVNEFWDGKVDGQPAPQGVYAYRLQATLGDGQTVEKNGTITLVR